MEKSESIGNLAKALAIFQGNVTAVKKDATNPFFKSKYASLGNIIDTIRTPLSEAGLSYSQIPDGEETLTTILMHSETGEYIMASYNIHAKAKDPQGIGSAMTYARRYALSAILGLNTDDDDDANAAQGNQGQPTKAEVRDWRAKLDKVTTKKALGELFNQSKPKSEHPTIQNLFSIRKAQLSKPNDTPLKIEEPAAPQVTTPETPSSTTPPPF